MRDTKTLQGSTRSGLYLGLALSLLGAGPGLAAGPGISTVDRGPEERISASVDFEKPSDLEAQGWTEAEPGVWQKTLDNGIEAELAVGAPALDRALAWIDAEIADLRIVDEPSDEQQLRLFELFVRRDQLTEAHYPTKALTRTTSLCSGTASFEHNYGWANLAYAFAEADTNWQQWFYLSGTFTTYAQASICAGGNCYPVTDIDQAQTPFSLHSHAYSSPYPSYTCSAHANGYVQVPASGSCQTLATFSTSWNCGDPIP